MKAKIHNLYGFEPDDETIKKLNLWRELFVEYNSHTNLMSKNDMPHLFNKHVLDSLAICLLPEFKNGGVLLDVGAGGGFPSLIISIFFKNIKVIALDSIRKKTDFLTIVKNELKLNIEIITERAEAISPLNVDFLVNRAVGTIDKVWNLAGLHLKSGGYFVSYKAKSAKEEAKIAQKLFPELIEPRFFKYELPLKENYTRELVVFKKGL